VNEIGCTDAPATKYQLRTKLKSMPMLFSSNLLTVVKIVLKRRNILAGNRKQLKKNYKNKLTA